jgi:CheY-like chemotaxis protein/HD-like signal output (HDOD) protein
VRLILVVDDMSVFREPIAASLRLEGYETLGASDGEEALRLTRARRPDLILLDVSLPKMDGLTFLKRLRADASIASIPVILLTALAEKENLVAAASLGVRDYLLKSRFRLEELLERIRNLEVLPAPAVDSRPFPVPLSAIPSGPSQMNGNPTANVRVGRATTEIPRLLTREQCLRRVEQVFEGRKPSNVVAHVLKMASASRGDMSGLAGLLGSDSILSARILQASNSAALSSGRRGATSVPEAISNAGGTTIRSISAALGAFDWMASPSSDGFNPIRYWQHSFAVAELCVRLTPAHFRGLSGIAYMVGLCHDFGEIFLRTQLSVEYQQIAETAASTMRSKSQLYGRMLGVTPALLTDAVLKCMRLPDTICEPVKMFHSISGPQFTNPPTRTLWLAENYANAAMIASDADSEVAPFTREFCRDTLRNDNPSRPDPRAFASEIRALTGSVATLSRDDEASFLAPMFQSRQTSIWIARDPLVSDFDPIATALGLLAKTTVSRSLPGEIDADRIDGLVVVASSANAAGFTEQEIAGALARATALGNRIPLLAIGEAGTLQEDRRPHGTRWRKSVTLADLAAFTELQERRKTPAAA